MLLLALCGHGALTIDHAEDEPAPKSFFVVPRGAGRPILAGPGSLAYVSAHAMR